MRNGLSVNRLAWKLLDRLCENAEFYGVKIEETPLKTRIIDAGIEAEGGFEAGQIITEMCMGGCARTEMGYMRVGELDLPSIFVYSDHPVIATLGSQFAGWQIKEEGYFAIGSGPARALALKPKRIFEQIKYKDDFDKALVILEADKHPPEKLLERFANDCNVKPENLAVVLTPTASLSGGVQISGRIIETGIQKLMRLGMNVNAISYAWGCAPIAPLHPKFEEAMARTNDAILYGGTASYVVEYADEEELRRIAGTAPSNASKSYGKPFIEIFKEAGFDFYRIDPNLFAPAVVVINNVKSGNTFRCGNINAEALAKSFGFVMNP